MPAKIAAGHRFSVGAGNERLAQFMALQVAERQVAILWLGQSGFVLRFAGANVLVDAFLSEHPERQTSPAFDPNVATALDVIAATHEHADHLDIPTVLSAALASPKARIVVPLPITSMLTEAGLPNKRVLGMGPDEPEVLGKLQIRAIPAMHGIGVSDAYSFGTKWSDGDVRYLGYVFSCAGVSVYHAGDTIPYDGMAATLRDLNVDVALLPINGRDPEREALGIVGNLSAEEAAQVAEEASFDTVIPMHHDMFARNPGYPDLLVKAVLRSGSEVMVVVPGLLRTMLYTKTR